MNPLRRRKRFLLAGLLTGSLAIAVNPAPCDAAAKPPAQVGLQPPAMEGICPRIASLANTGELDKLTVYPGGSRASGDPVYGIDGRYYSFDHSGGGSVVLESRDADSSHPACMFIPDTSQPADQLHDVLSEEGMRLAIRENDYMAIDWVMARGGTEGIRTLLRLGMRPDAHELVMDAITQKTPERLILLLEHGLPPGEVRICDLLERPDLLETLLMQGGDANASCMGTTALSIAVWRDRLAAIPVLLKHGADPHLGNPSAAEEARFRGSPAARKALAEHARAQPSVAEGEIDTRLCRLVEDAIRRKDIESVRILMKRGAPLNVPVDGPCESPVGLAMAVDSEEILQFLASLGPDLSSPRVAAGAIHNPAMLKKSLASGADPNMVLTWLPVHEFMPDRFMSKRLLAYIAELEFFAFSRSRNPGVPLESARLLLDYGADPDVAVRRSVRLGTAGAELDPPVTLWDLVERKGSPEWKALLLEAKKLGKARKAAATLLPTQVKHCDAAGRCFLIWGDPGVSVSEVGMFADLYCEHYVRRGCAAAAANEALQPKLGSTGLDCPASLSAFPVPCALHELGAASRLYVFEGSVNDMNGMRLEQALSPLRTLR